jgi:hypothetical protein
MMQIWVDALRDRATDDTDAYGVGSRNFSSYILECLLVRIG